MKSSALTLALLCSGQALASLNCTVAAPTLTKRLCESDACAAYDTVEAGANLHAACRADCSTDDEYVHFPVPVLSWLHSITDAH